MTISDIQKLIKFVYTIFKRPQQENDIHNDSQNVTQNRPQTTSSSRNARPNVTQNDRQNVKISERQATILSIIKNNAYRSATNIAKSFGVDRRTIYRDIAFMNKYISIKWVGPSKTGHWEIDETHN